MHALCADMAEKMCKRALVCVCVCVCVHTIPCVSVVRAPLARSAWLSPPVLSLAPHKSVIPVTTHTQTTLT